MDICFLACSSLTHAFAENLRREPSLKHRTEHIDNWSIKQGCYNAKDIGAKNVGKDQGGKAYWIWVQEHESEKAKDGAVEQR